MKNVAITTSYFGLEGLLNFLLVERDLLFMLAPQVLVTHHTKHRQSPALVPSQHVASQEQFIDNNTTLPSFCFFSEWEAVVGYLQGLGQFEVVVLPDPRVHLHYPLLLLTPRLSHLL